MRPRSAYAFGYIDRWAHLASFAPGLANLATQLPGLRGAANSSQESLRTAPFRSSPRNFQKLVRAQTAPDNRPEVLLWPDTFNSYFLPRRPRPPLKCLKAQAFKSRCRVPDCVAGGRSTILAMLDRAQRLLRQILDTLAPEIEAGTPVVALEPSCAAVFRDELLNFFPNDPKAQALARQTFCSANPGIPRC